MKQKFLLLKNAENNELIIKEYSELDAEQYTLICEQTYDMNKVNEVLSAPTELYETIRNNNFYPIQHIMEKIFSELQTLLPSQEEESVEFFFEDMEIIAEYVPEEDEDDEDEDSSNIDSLLEVDDDDDLDLKTSDPIDSSIDKISIDNSDMDD